MIETKPRYHHGDLPNALLHSARILLEQDGITALKLRAITRHAGVSATAATPHFGNLAGILSALAAIGFEELSAAMSSTHGKTPREIGLAYIRFAIANPGLFTLMFRNDSVDRTTPDLQKASKKALSCLTPMVSHNTTATAFDNATQIASIWAKLHGLAILALDGQLQALTPTPLTPITLEKFLSNTLNYT
ncbi:TetR family transcriptional regulator [Neokomagataea thailandica NBRC 106555]|uniref:TetR/AcrR family transcriptional regulator n=2 Tax=Neokomagataea TaxID=1223423 RepID=A0A4Y6V7W1_9PROT|nr:MULTISPECIES: TetR/AcrR family transcriptional regulator [Neokomagataea]QDH24721.1 TetR/AcrR family transcriptional regulator [Neokomagataea tanensis]GBR53747.1 TetR family transcriptional regulator [Neokomagataea thailandica NBRC 106555]